MSIEVERKVDQLLELLKRKDHELHPWLAARAEIPLELRNEALGPLSGYFHGFR